MKKEDEPVVKNGAPWDSDSVHNTFLGAASRQKELKEKVEGIQVKIKRRDSTGNFVVKTRPHPDAEPKKTEKKKKKSKKKVEILEENNNGRNKKRKGS